MHNLLIKFQKYLNYTHRLVKHEFLQNWQECVSLQPQLLKQHILFMTLKLPLSRETRQLGSMALPIIFSSLLQLSYEVIDMLWVGYLGSDEVAAVGTSSFYIKFGWALVSMVIMGSTVLVSHCVGAKDDSAKQAVVSTAIRANLVVGLCYAAILFIFPGVLIQFFNLDNMRVTELATTYLRISSAIIPFAFVNMLLGGFFNAHGMTKESFRAGLCGNVINVLLDPLFILTFGLGVAGAAWATLIAQICTTVFFLYRTRKLQLFRFSLQGFAFERLRRILKIGSATAAQRILFTGIAMIIARIISSWGAEAIAAQKLGLQIEALSFMLMGGIMQATSILVGQRFGEKNAEAIRTVYRSGLRGALLISTLSTLFFLCFDRSLIALFVDDVATIDIGASYIRIIAFSQLFMAIEMISGGSYNGLGLTKYPATVSILFTSIRIPLSLFLAYQTPLGLDGVWWSIAISSMLKGTLLYVLFQHRLKNLEKIL